MKFGCIGKLSPNWHARFIRGRNWAVQEDNPYFKINHKYINKECWKIPSETISVSLNVPFVKFDLVQKSHFKARYKFLNGVMSWFSYLDFAVQLKNWVHNEFLGECKLCAWLWSHWSQWQKLPLVFSENKILSNAHRLWSCKCWVFWPRSSIMLILVLNFKHVSSPSEVNDTVYVLKVKYMPKCFARLGWYAQHLTVPSV